MLGHLLPITSLPITYEQLILIVVLRSLSYLHFYSISEFTFFVKLNFDSR